MNKQAAKNTFLIVAALGMTGVGFVAMLVTAPMFTMAGLGLIGMGFLIRAIYNLEKSRIECEQSQVRSRDLR